MLQRKTYEEHQMNTDQNLRDRWHEKQKRSKIFFSLGKAQVKSSRVITMKKLKSNGTEKTKKHNNFNVELLR